MPTDARIIEFEDASYSYDGTSLALNGLSFHVEEGEFVCVLGGNGSGKSTLARHVDALLVPDLGMVRVLGLSTSDQANLYEIRSNSGLVFQNPDDQIVAAVVEDDVAFGPENLGVPSTELPERVRSSLEKVGLQGFEERETFALSGGQKQRVAIAGALAVKPRILVFDEASAMLDPRGRKGLIKLCHQLNESGITVVLITHFMDEAAQADRVVVLDGGKVALQGSPEEVLTQARRLRELSLEVPFATQMSLALQDEGVPVETCIEGAPLEAQLARMLGDTVRPMGHRDSPYDSSEAAAPSGANVPEEEGEPIITLENVSFSYAPKKARKRGSKGVGHLTQSQERSQPAWGDDASNAWALQDVSFSLREGDFLGIAGHTGSGKSTLTQLMAGLLQPTQGEVLARGRSLADKHNKHEIQRSVGLVFQYPEHQLFASTVFEDVAFGPRNLGLGHDEVEERVREALKAVHLDPDELEPRNPFELSGGQQRRVALAGVLAMKPSVLILDEPTAGLDPRAHRLFLELIAELHEASNAATVMVSHNMDDIAELCNRVMLLNKGRVVADGDPLLIYSDEAAIKGIGLDVPHTVHLADSLGLMGGFNAIPTVGQLTACIKDAWHQRQAGDGR